MENKMKQKLRILRMAENCEWYFRHSHSTECPRCYPFTSQYTENEVWLKINCSFLINQRWIGFRSKSFSEIYLTNWISYDMTQLWLWQRHWDGYFYEKFKTWFYCFCLLHCSCFGIVFLLYLKNPGETKEGQLYYVVIHFLYTTQQSSNRYFYSFFVKSKYFKGCV